MVACHQAVLVTTFSWLLGGAVVTPLLPHRGGRCVENESAVAVLFYFECMFFILIVGNRNSLSDNHILTITYFTC